jgi:hypothetical protein
VWTLHFITTRSQHGWRICSYTHHKRNCTYQIKVKLLLLLSAGSCCFNSVLHSKAFISYTGLENWFRFQKKCYVFYQLILYIVTCIARLRLGKYIS